ncbi:MAG: ABC transporter ATP-binding protein, partial [Candidatus Bathyarchaeota archaeon]
RNTITTIIGPNGSGKTTLLRILAFLDKPTVGEIYFNGVKVENGNRAQMRANCTMVFQKTALFDTTVDGNISYGLKLRKLSRREIAKRVCEVLELVKLEGYERRQAKKLSGGEQQRVSLARALALDTELLLLDEPTANLDPKNVSIIEEAIKNVRHEHETTIVTTTHNMFQAESITERAALVLRGKVVETGTSSEIFGKASRSLVGFARLENIFSGISTVGIDGTSVVEVNDSVQIEAALRKPGKITVLVRPEDIIVSKKAIDTSARNIFEGKIVSISEQDSTIKLKVDAGTIFVAQITKRSFSEMRLNLNSKVFLTFKASSVYLV